MKKILIGLSLAVSLFASIESEVDAERFSWKDGVLTDSFAGMQWQDNKDAKTVERNWQGAKDYCANLNLNSQSDWRLPNIEELEYAYKINKKFYNSTDLFYWSSTTKSNNSSVAGGYSFYCWSSKRAYVGKTNPNYMRCIRGKQYDTLIILENKVQKNRKIVIKNIYKLAYKKAKAIHTTKSYMDFIKEYPNAPQVKEALQAIFNLTKKQNNISGYEWFIKIYPKASQVKEAIKNIHKLAYNEAKSINTVSAYNTFIISYPFASQVKEANDRAYKIEEKKYTDLGMLGFYDKDAKMDRKGRELLNRAKIIERKGIDKSDDAKAGYILVSNRMYTLLQDRFTSSDATTRYLESQEFKDFTRAFKTVMRNISYKLDNIADYSSQMLEVSQQGFEDAKADRQMSRYKNEEHVKWEKRMHLREKGYN